MSVEKVVIDYLKEQLDVPVGPEKPGGPPDSYCMIIKTGSDEKDMLKAANIAVYSVGPTKWAAIRLNDDVKAAMRELRQDTADVFSCRCTTDYDATDTRTREYRYCAVFRVVYVDE